MAEWTCMDPDIHDSSRKEKPPMQGVDLIGDQQGWQVGKSGPGIKLSTIVRTVLL